MAKEWGTNREQDGYANCYELLCDDLRILDLNAPEYNISPFVYFTNKDGLFVYRFIEPIGS